MPRKSILEQNHFQPWRKDKPQWTEGLWLILFIPLSIAQWAVPIYFADIIGVWWALLAIIGSYVLLFAIAYYNSKDNPPNPSGPYDY